MNIQSSVIPSISGKKIKVFIAVPARDTVYAHFAYCLQELVKYHSERQIDTTVEFNLGTLVGNQRESLAKRALDVGATHIMWLDSDMMFPKNVCEALLKHRLSFVACNYSTRALPFKAVAYTEVYNWDSGIGKDDTGVNAIEGIGFGCVLMETKMLDNIRRPWFPVTYNASTDDYLGEDMNFCIKAREEGYDLAVDLDLSRHIFHIGTAALQWNRQPLDSRI